MAPKDSLFGGRAPSTSLSDVVLKLSSSMRAWTSLQLSLADARLCDTDPQIHLVLNPWDEDMDPSSEYRVFVPPPAVCGAPALISHFAVSAISQYEWHAPFRPLPGSSCSSLAQTATTVAAGATALLSQIKSFIDETMARSMCALLVEHGFTFDISVRRDGEVRLVEVNPFGAMSACGAGLFHWVKDVRMLYGLEGELVVAFAVNDGGTSEGKGWDKGFV